jgi:hypothetical protein
MIGAHSKSYLESKGQYIPKREKASIAPNHRVKLGAVQAGPFLRNETCCSSGFRQVFHFAIEKDPAFKEPGTSLMMSAVREYVGPSRQEVVRP